MTTDADLRNALIEAVDAQIDVEAFRARLQTMISDEGGDTDEARVFELQQSAPRREPRRSSHRWAPVAVAACLAAVAAIAWAVTVRHTDKTPPTHPAPRTLQVFGVPLFPGSVVLGVMHGTGSQTVPFPTGHAIPGPHQHYMVYLDCSTGRWTLSSKQSGDYFGRCADMVGGNSVERTQNSVHVEVEPDATWRLAIVIEPDAQTNAFVVTGNGPDMRPGPIHRGDGVVTFRHSRYGFQSELHMTCSGTGFRLSGMDGAVEGDYTHTCFEGFTYVWNLHDVILPATLHVHADPGTTWTVTLN